MFENHIVYLIKKCSDIPKQDMFEKCYQINYLNKNNDFLNLQMHFYRLILSTQKFKNKKSKYK